MFNGLLTSESIFLLTLNSLRVGKNQVTKGSVSGIIGLPTQREQLPVVLHVVLDWVLGLPVISQVHAILECHGIHALKLQVHTCQNAGATGVNTNAVGTATQRYGNAQGSEGSERSGQV